MSLVQIVPRLPPAVDGLGDYALNLAREFRKSFGIESRFVVGDPDWIGGVEIEGFATSRLASRSPGALLSNLESSEPPLAVLLHYVGYGYAKRGAPGWLIKGLESWRSNNEDARLLAAFHEVYATGPFWTSSFWLSSSQKHLAARLSRVSDSCLTSRQGYAEQVRLLSHNKHISIPTLPVFSNIGEPKTIPTKLKDRNRRLVIFGAPGNRLRVYENSLEALERVCKALEIQEVLDIGPPTGLAMAKIDGVPVVEMGQRPADEASALLSDSVAGFFNYHPAFLAKSTIFAAYSAHRLIPINALNDDSQADGLQSGKHYWTANPDKKLLPLEVGQDIADNAYRWYQPHNLSEHSKAFAALLGKTQDRAALNQRIG